MNALWQHRPDADEQGDSEPILRTLDDYTGSWFDRDAEAVRRSVHPALAERKVVDPSSSTLDLDENTFEELLEVVAQGPDKPVERVWKAEVLDVSGDIASGKVTAAWWDTYLHLARFDDSWMIVNILYRSTWIHVTAPETRYAKTADGVHIAYEVVGDGPVDIVFVMGWTSHIELMWEEPSLARFLNRLASFSRLILFDKRGMGLSDRVPDDRLPSLEVRMDDARAVMDAVGSERAVVFGVSEGGPMATLFAATYPERSIALVLFGTGAC